MKQLTSGKKIYIKWIQQEGKRVKLTGQGQTNILGLQ